MTATGCPACQGKSFRVPACDVLLFEPDAIDDIRRAVFDGDPLPPSPSHWTLHAQARNYVGRGLVGVDTYRDLVRRNPLLRAQNTIEREQAHSFKLGAMFEKFVSPEVRRQLMDSRSLETVVAGELREVSCLFCDIRGFTSRAEHRDPETLFRELNAYFAEVVDAVMATDGTIDKFIGDAVMVVYSAPLHQPDHAARALDCALAIRGRIAAFNARNSSDLPIRFGIGINSGPAAAGCVGTDQRMEYTVLGDTVNVAARLEARAAADQILLSETTRQLAGERFETRSVGALELKGKRIGVAAFELLRAITPTARGTSPAESRSP